ncbi:NAD(P)-dependent oxidoreductase [Microbacterium rhizomatis]|uniref:NAD(P)-dependent oxidoreductase n=2 Tax=Microbacterium rhizomatis TaxID=1631477 RepID=A0A5J5IVZ8_9MICO|nr:NAD(P)-dependent oxidoreductase [Microbacterium rhizomatis]
MQGPGELGAYIAVVFHAPLADIVGARRHGLYMLMRQGPPWVQVRGHTVVQTETFTTGFSQTLTDEITRAGGHYVEAPVSGSGGPAIDGSLVAMLAGPDDSIRFVEPLIEAMYSQRFYCGPVPAALSMKLAVNTFLITMVTGLAESFHFAKHVGVDSGVLREVLAAGQMASLVSRGKALKLTAGDLEPQAAIADVPKTRAWLRRRLWPSGPLIHSSERAANCMKKLLPQVWDRSI